MGVLPVDEAIERQLLNIIMDEAIEKQLLNIIICQRKNQLKDEVRDHTGPHIISITLKKNETLLLYKRWTAVFCIMKTMFKCNKRIFFTHSHFKFENPILKF